MSDGPGWDVIREHGVVNVIPVDDERPHIQFANCPCRPSVEHLGVGRMLIGHNSWDGREFSEPDFQETLVKQ